MRNPNFRFRGLWARQFGGGAIDAASMLFTFPPGSWTFTAPAPGLWQTAIWGPGGASAAAGGAAAGALCVKTVRLALGQQIALVIAQLNAASTATFPAGLGGPMSAGNGAGGLAPGVATGGGGCEFDRRYKFRNYWWRG